MGCDAGQWKSEDEQKVFQSTHPRGVRHGGFEDLARMIEISIHAPTWGATFPRLDTNPMTGFQSTHPRGVRPHTPETSSSRRNFNPRTHVGCDRSPRSSIPTSGYFNPRTHVGCDLDHERQVVGHHISIHAPTWGATSEAFGIPNLKAFQSTHPRGVRRTTPTRRRSCGISIHAPTWGATEFRQPPRWLFEISIHAPTWGATTSRR